MSKQLRERNAQAYLFLSPFLIFITVLYILPAIITVAMAFTDLDGAFVWGFNGLNNFRKILIDPNTPVIALNTVLYVGISIFFTVVLDLFFAIMTTYFIRDEKKGNLFKSVLMIPMITPAVVYSVLWLWLLEANENGLVNKLFLALGGSAPVNWIAEAPFAVIVLATLLTSIAYGTTVFSSAVKSIPENQFRAARVDGAGEWEIVRNIILPNLRYHITFITLWETLGLLTNYVTIMLITNGGPGVQTEVWALSAYHKAFADSQYGYGAAISLVLILVVMVLMLIIGAVMRRQEKARL